MTLTRIVLFLVSFVGFVFLFSSSSSSSFFTSFASLISFNFKSNNALLCPHSDGCVRLTLSNCRFAAIKIFAFFTRGHRIMRRRQQLKTKHRSENRFLMDEDWRSEMLTPVGTAMCNGFQGFSNFNKNVWIFSTSTPNALHKYEFHARTHFKLLKMQRTFGSPHVDVYLSKKIYDKRQAIQLT